RIRLNLEVHAVAEVNPDQGAESATCNLVMEPARSLTGTVIGPDGKPLAGTIVRGLQHQDVWDQRPQGEEFSLFVPNPGEQRLLQFSHKEMKLAGSLVIRGDEKGPLTVKLESAGILTGRFVTPDGKPFADMGLMANTQA